MTVSTRHGRPTAAPARKVTAGGISVPLSMVLVYVLDRYVLPEPLPVEIATAVGGIVAVLVAYFTPPGDGEGVGHS